MNFWLSCSWIYYYIIYFYYSDYVIIAKFIRSIKRNEKFFVSSVPTYRSKSDLNRISHRLKVQGWIF